MAFKVFLSYGLDQESQVTAWRLQTLGTSYGIEVVVPQRNGLQSHSAVPQAEIRRAIDASDCVVAIITGPIGPYLEGELNYALQKKKVIVPIVQYGAANPDFVARFPQTFQLSPWQDPTPLSDIMEFLKKQRLSKDNQQALGALVVAGLGLLFLWAVAKK